MGIKYQLQKRAEELDKKAPGSGAWHSSFYQSYFEGYTEYYVTKPDGNRRLERVYTGIYYSQALSTPTRVLIRLLYSVLFILSVIAFFFGANSAGTEWYVVLFIAASVPFFFLTLWSMFLYLTAPLEMTRYEFLRTTNIKKYAAITAVCLFGAAIATIVSSFQESPIHVPWNSLLLLVVSGFCMTGISAIERHIQYNKRLSDQNVPSNGIEIGEGID